VSTRGEVVDSGAGAGAAIEVSGDATGAMAFDRLQAEAAKASANTWNGREEGI
jgi:hypothetical protein